MSKEENRINALPKLKRLWKISSIYLLSIDSSIVEKLGISEHNTLFEQEITEEGILMRVKNVGVKSESYH
jgi:hypothetical protein